MTWNLKYWSLKKSAYRVVSNKIVGALSKVSHPETDIEMLFCFRGFLVDNTQCFGPSFVKHHSHS